MTKSGNRTKHQGGPCHAGSGHTCRLDLAHLRRFTHGDSALESELLGLFRVQARVQLDVISIATLPADYKLAVHTLKGAALVVGAMEIVTITRELEGLGFPGDASKRRGLLQRLAEETAAIEAEIASLTG